MDSLLDLKCSMAAVVGSKTTIIKMVSHDPFLTGVNILSRDPLGATFQQKKIQLKLVNKQKS